jgi:hypothetical protein
MNIDGKTLRKFFASYWLLHSALYNFAQGLENQRNRRFTWAITNYYYCMVYIGRLFMFLTKDLYFLYHKNLIWFFKSENNIGRVWKLEEDGDFRKFNISRNQNIGDNINIKDISKCIGWDEEKIKKFGEILGNLKKFREENTYEAFIIYAQENHIVLTDFIMSATDGVRNIVEGYLKEACKVFFNYWRNESEEIIKLLGHEWLIPRTLKTLKRQNLPYNEIKVIIENTIPKISQLHENEDNQELIREFEEVCNFSNFGAKKNIANEALKTFKKLIEINKDDKER